MGYSKKMPMVEKKCIKFGISNVLFYNDKGGIFFQIPMKDWDNFAAALGGEFMIPKILEKTCVVLKSEESGHKQSLVSGGFEVQLNANFKNLVKDKIAEIENAKRAAAESEAAADLEDAEFFMDASYSERASYAVYA